MSIDWARVAPVIVSICIIILVAVVRQYSKAFAAIAATMPINIPLGMWIVTSGSDDPQAALAQFMEAAMINSLPLVVFLLLGWHLARSGHSLIVTITVGYIGWGVALGLVFLVRALLTR
jgi:hypothetical protein